MTTRPAPHKAEPIDGYTAIDERTHIAQIKYDGWRLMAHVRPDATVTAWTGSAGNHDGRIPAIYAELARRLPADTIVDGEIAALRQTDTGFDNDFAHVCCVMKSDPSVAVAKQHAARPLDLYIFDALRIAGEDVTSLPYAERRQRLEDALTGTGERVTLAPDLPARQDIHDALVASGFEGTIVRRLDAPYAAGRRGRGVYKVKAAWDMDVIVTGYKPGNGKYEGMVGAVEFSQPCPTTGRMIVRGYCSGMDLATRRQLTAGFAALKDRLVITIRHNGVFPGGVAVRHPQWQRPRFDKVAADVDWHSR